MNYFSSNLRYLRNLKKLSQNKLAELANVNQTTIMRWELGDMSPSLDNIYDVSKALDVEIADLTGKDLSQSETINQFNELEILFNKAKDKLDPSQEATIKFVMQDAIKKYEEEKNKGLEK